MQARLHRYMFRDKFGNLEVRYRTNLKAALESVPYRFSSELNFTITKIKNESLGQIDADHEKRGDNEEDARKSLARFACAPELADAKSE